MFFLVFNLAWASVCGAGEKGSPATAGEPLADSSAMVHLSVFSAALPSRSDFFWLISSLALQSMWECRSLLLKKIVMRDVTPGARLSPLHLLVEKLTLQKPCEPQVSAALLYQVWQTARCLQISLSELLGVQE